MRGSQHNDIFNSDGTTQSNLSGGIQGGISNGMDIYFRVAFKPVSTLMKEQKSIDANSWAKNGQTAEYRRVMYDEAVYRIRLLLGSSLPSSNMAVTASLKDSLTNLQQFGLGVTRTLDEFIEFTGIDTKSNFLYR